MHCKNYLDLAAALAVSASLIAAPVTVAAASPAIDANAGRSPLGGDPRSPGAPASRVVGETTPGSAAPAAYIVQLVDAPLASYRGGRAGLAATSPSVTRSGLDRSSAAVGAYSDFLRTRQDDVLRAVSDRIGRSPDVRFRYMAAFHGFTLSLTPKEADAVAGLDGVRRVQKEWIAQPQTDRGPHWIGADLIWAADPTAGRGEGVVVGIIDTGINFDSPSFTATASDGYTHTNPRSRFYGVCDPTSPSYDAAFACNDKLIGAWDFADRYMIESDGPADSEDHGSHTAATVAGNPVTAVITAPTTSITAAISGVAPRANIIAYDACIPDYGCPSGALIAAIDQAAADGVDVINFSIGSSSRDPWTSADALAMLGALDAGVFVAVSAGNDGPHQLTHGAPANAPWVTSVGASTHDRRFVSAVTGRTNGATSQPDVAGLSISAGYGPARVVDAVNYTSTYTTTTTDGLCRAPFPAGTFQGEIVVCERGENGRVEKGANVLAGGAGGMILVNDVINGDSLSADMHVLPAVHVGYADGAALRSWIAGSAIVTGNIAPFSTSFDAAYGDVMAAFSSRGPDYSTIHVLKPDVAAPGVDIIAAAHSGADYVSMSGTSMAAPHTAGAAALLTAQHPSWTPSEIRSALMLSARTVVTREDSLTPANPFDRGAGRIDVADAHAAQLVLDENASDFYTADPSYGGDPSSLNLASLMHSNCTAICSWTRTFRNAGDAPDSWTIAAAGAGFTLSASPVSFTLDAGRTQVVTFTADASAADVEAWHFGVVTLTASTVARMPVAVYAVRGSAPQTTGSILEVPIRSNTGSLSIDGLRSITSDAVTGTASSGGEVHSEHHVAQDPTPNDPYDSPVGTFTTTIPVTASTRMVQVRTSHSTAYDLDLFVGVDGNGDGQLDMTELFCRSGFSTAEESCLIRYPTMELLALVQNYSASASITDTFTLSILTLSGDSAGSAVTVQTPDSAVAARPFSADVAWNLPDLPMDESYYALIEVGTSPTQTNDILSRILRFTRSGDEVTIRADSETMADGVGYLLPGQTVSFTTTLVQRTETPSATHYVITATLPEGIDYAPSSARISGRGIDGMAANVEPTIDGRTAVWSLLFPPTRPNYTLYTNDPTRPDYSEMCRQTYADSGGTAIRPSLAGDGQTWNFESLTNETNLYSFFGRSHSLLYFSDDGVLSFDSRNDLLDEQGSAPNALIAPFRADMEVVSDLQNGRGIGLVYGDGRVRIDYVGIQPAGDPSARLSVKAEIHRTVSPSRPEIVFMYGPISGTLPTPAIGLQAADSSAGISYTGAVTSNLTLCFDWSIESIALNYAGVVRSDAPLDAVLTTTVHSRPDIVGAQADVTTLPLFVSGVALQTSVAAPDRVTPGSPITYTLYVTNSGAATAKNISLGAGIPLGAVHLAGGVLTGDRVSFTIASLAGGDGTSRQFSVLPTLVTTTLRAAPARPSIISGTISAAGAWPWQAAIIYDMFPDAAMGQFCGGTLISRDFVLTAAHCVEGLAPYHLRVMLGRTKLSENGGQEIAVTEIITHPEYRTNSLGYDIALLRLATPAIIGDDVQPIQTASPAFSAQFAAGITATITGWGDTDPTQNIAPSDDLREARVSILDRATCAASYAKFGLDVTADMLCAGSMLGGADACQGDSGGPLVVPHGERWLLAGVTSWGITCGAPNNPGVYTRVASFARYIRDMQNSLGLVSVAAADATKLAGHSTTGAMTRRVVVSKMGFYLPATLRMR